MDDSLASTASDANAAAFIHNQKPRRQPCLRTPPPCQQQQKHTRACTQLNHCQLHVAADRSDNITTFTVFPLAPLPCRMQGSIVATAPCLFIPAAAAAAILRRQRRRTSRYL
ncbi:hypothetical protein INR49_030673 [Caranx melampygus]|nr:hypothetical protein INR49_030673 [Caranx melampygus]